MAGKINLANFQMVGVNGMHGMVTENHLGALFQLDTQRAADTITLLQAKVTGNNTLENFLSKFPTRTFKDDTDFVWDVLLSASRNYPLVGARDENGLDTDGKTSQGGGGVSTYYIHAISFTSQTDACIKLLHVFHTETLGDAQRDRNLARHSIHGIDVRKVDYRCLIAQVF